MGRFVTRLLAAMLVLSVSTSAAQAVGLGVYAQRAAGTGSLEDDNYSVDVDETTFAAGFVLDTSTRDASGFNYRLQVGYAQSELEDRGRLDLEGLVIDNTFGFAMVRNRGFRLWMGPQVRIGFLTGDDVDLATFGLGLVLGTNFGFSDAFGMSIAAGVRFSGYAGEDDLSNDITGDSTTGFVDLSFLFETGR